MSKVNKYNLVSENPQSTVVAQYTPVYRTAQYAVFKAVNTELITLYWDIGLLIVEWQKKHGWGKAIVENLAEDLQLEFSGTLGFSKASLWRMKLFYEEYANNAKRAPLVREIGWSHNFVLWRNARMTWSGNFISALEQVGKCSMRYSAPGACANIGDCFVALNH